MKKLLLAFFSFSFILSHAQMNRLSEQIGNVKKITSYTKNIRVCYAYELSNAFVEVSFISSTTVRVRATKAKPVDDFSFAIENPETFENFKVSEENKGDNTMLLSTDALKVEVLSTPFRINIYNKEGKLICGDDATLGISWFGNQVSC